MSRRKPEVKPPPTLALAPPALLLTKAVQEGGLGFHPEHQRHNSANKPTVLCQHPISCKTRKADWRKSSGPATKEDTELEDISSFKNKLLGD